MPGELCPYCLLPKEGRVPQAYYCRTIGDRLLSTPNGEPVRDDNCPKKVHTTKQCLVLSGHTIRPKLETRIGPGGKIIKSPN
ncbi:hypothetical protein A2872_02505 [Candidatus Gottesmanbacteria bacterium RIFCSPHIGHO2_01_FULL_42_12]|uniref:Uncharacterized protein n=1 Tax=Candidatus Gottesmanbacteria bacterium RIFCSPHIGHO2_01_FULL_42_12 TaxID=1798377 RepID=A0A1F5Z4S0_9BACT|nr:MAG: hypothetical protein A2872_02505 [Candidatus Gottesmanbacteria bacterium RIFCSPHIGHO2_01_FULL_42_12]